MVKKITEGKKFACGVVRALVILIKGHNYWEHCCGLGENRVRHASIVGIIAWSRYFDLLLSILVFLNISFLDFEEKKACRVHTVKNAINIMCYRFKIFEFSWYRALKNHLSEDGFVDIYFQMSNYGMV